MEAADPDPAAPAGVDEPVVLEIDSDMRYGSAGGSETEDVALPEVGPIDPLQVVFKYGRRCPADGHAVNIPIDGLDKTRAIHSPTAASAPAVPGPEPPVNGFE